MLLWVTPLCHQCLWASELITERAQTKIGKCGASSAAGSPSKTGCGFIPPLGLESLCKFLLTILSACLPHPKCGWEVPEPVIYGCAGSSAERRDPEETARAPSAQHPRNSKRSSLCAGLCCSQGSAAGASTAAGTGMLLVVRYHVTSSAF